MLPIPPNPRQEKYPEIQKSSPKFKGAQASAPGSRRIRDAPGRAQAAALVADGLTQLAERPWEARPVEELTPTKTTWNLQGLRDPWGRLSRPRRYPPAAPAKK